MSTIHISLYPFLIIKTRIVLLKMLANLNDVLLDAKKGKYAVGLFNTVNLEMAKGVIGAAEELHSPVIIGTAEVLTCYSTIDELAYFLIPIAKKAKVPVVLHFDHGYTEDLIKKAIRYGFTSVMYDCSTMSFEDNIAAVARMVKYCHLRNVTVEGELGHVGANEGGSAEGNDTGSIYTDPFEAQTYAERTGVDALAIAVGTAHGAYKSKPKLDFERMTTISNIVKSPLVLHGGSGLSDEDFKNSIAHGISKVNIFTDINAASAQAAAATYMVNTGMTDMMPKIIQAIKESAMEKMRIFGSVNHG